MLMPRARTSDPKAEPSLNRRQRLLMSDEKKKEELETWLTLIIKWKQKTPEIQVAWAILDFF